MVEERVGAVPAALCSMCGKLKEMQQLTTFTGSQGQQWRVCSSCIQDTMVEKLGLIEALDKQGDRIEMEGGE